MITITVADLPLERAYRWEKERANEVFLWFLAKNKNTDTKRGFRDS
jgi:hypothetical protein